MWSLPPYAFLAVMYLSWQYWRLQRKPSALCPAVPKHTCVCMLCLSSSGADSTPLASQSVDADLDVTGSSSSSDSLGPPPSPALMLAMLPMRTTSLPVTPSPRAIPLSLVVFSGGTAFNSVAGERCHGCNLRAAQCQGCNRLKSACTRTGF